MTQRDLLDESSTEWVLQTALSPSDSITNGVATSPDGHIFPTLARINGSAGHRG